MKEKTRLRDETAKAHKVLVKERAKLSKLIRKIDMVSEDIQELADQSPQAGTNVPQEKKSSFLSKQSVESRWKHPAALPSNGQKGPASTVQTQRRSQTYQAAKEIHGAGLNDDTPAHIGLLSTTEKICPTKILVEFMSKSKKFFKKFSKCGHKILSSEDNFLIFGSNCSEQSTAARRYIAMIAKEMEEIEKGLFRFGDTIIRFRIARKLRKKDEISFNRETAGILGTVGATVATVATAGTVVGASLTVAGAQTETRAATETKAIGAVTGAAGSEPEA
ncbi:PREDICTED: uncharacterized protein LOC107351673 [Acropora digitifera]|uniref:uncharacterized protein LOC107351673 n=1 Tax=Acropora digitifera TaxID=70779 RepID=UPI00077A9F2A|nr:PREDICTED: uncharacterized protein LOC107351673 [Acropora digitifera]